MGTATADLYVLIAEGDGHLPLAEVELLVMAVVVVVAAVVRRVCRGLAPKSLTDNLRSGFGVGAGHQEARYIRAGCESSTKE